MPISNNPTSGFQLSALPQSLSVPSNIGKFDVGQTQQAYANSLKNAQATALVGPETAAAISQAKYQQAKNAQLTNLLDPEEQAALQELNARRLTAKLSGSIAQAQLPTAEDIARQQAQLTFQETLNKANYAKTYGGMFGSGTPAPFVNTGLSTVQPSQSAVPSGLTAPNADVSNYLFDNQPSTSKSTSLGSFGTQSVAQPIPSTPLATPVKPLAQTLPATPVQPTSEAKTLVSKPSTDTSRIQYDDQGNANINGVTVPSNFANSPIGQNLIKSGYEPQGTPFEWAKIDRQNLTKNVIAIGPNGMENKGLQSLPPSQIKQIELSRNATALARQLDPNYKEEPTETANITKAAELYSDSLIRKNNQKYPAVNPAKGFTDPDKAQAALAKAKDNSLKVLDIDNDLHNDVVNLRSNLQTFQAINQQVPTGILTGSSVAQKFLSGEANIKDLLSSLSGQEQTWASDPNNAAKLEKLQQLHSSIIPGLVRTMNSKATSSSSTTGGSSGLGRLMVNELPWLSSSSPSAQMLNTTNNSIINETLNKLDKIDDFTAYRNQYFNDYGSLEGSTSNFRKAEGINPYFNPDGSINNNRRPWNEVLMSDEYNKNPENMSGSRPNYQNIFVGSQSTAQATPQADKQTFISSWLKEHPISGAQPTNDEIKAAYKAYKTSSKK
jgi:hypothetical protein